MNSISIVAGVSKKTHKSYDVRFFSYSIHTIVTSDPETVADWLSLTEKLHRRRLQYLVVGLDTERRHSFNDQQNPVAILQLCVGRRCLIFQIFHSVSIPDKLREFLAQEEYSFVGVGIQNNLERLNEDYNIVVGGRIMDLRRLVAETYNDYRWNNVGLTDLATVVLGKSVQKPVQVAMSRWDIEWLNQDQVMHACLDAFISFQIGRLLNPVEKPTGSPWDTVNFQLFFFFFSKP